MLHNVPSVDTGICHGDISSNSLAGAARPPFLPANNPLPFRKHSDHFLNALTAQILPFFNLKEIKWKNCFLSRFSPDIHYFAHGTTKIQGT